jgi:hypothetical protein
VQNDLPLPTSTPHCLQWRLCRVDPSLHFGQNDLPLPTSIPHSLQYRFMFLLALFLFFILLGRLVESIDRGGA